MDAFKILIMTHVPYILLATAGIFILRSIRKELKSLNKSLEVE